MYDINSVVLSGNAVSDPEHKDVSGTDLCKFRLASNRGPKEKERTVYIDVECWGVLARIANENLTKGRKVVVSGELKHETWEGENGKRSRISLVGRDLIFGERNE